jgi:EAL domain-containing protein (putative c-di-GMP-specific phosphodiesterase class I)/DNA-binding NarL/FixJ family response regulator
MSMEERIKPVILCIDDESIFLESIENKLKETFGNEYSVITSKRSDLALEILKDCNQKGIEIPIIICDQLMPNLRGDEFFIQVQKTNPDTRNFLLVDFFTTKETAHTLNKANVYRVLSKPIEPKDLIQIIQGVVNSFYAQKVLKEKNAALEKSFFHNSDTNLGNWEKLQNRFQEYSSQGLTLTLAILKIENYAYFIEFFGAKIYKKILLELIETISERLLEDEEMFHTQQDEFLILSTKPFTEEFIHKYSLFRLMLKSEYIQVEGLSFQISLFISITNGNKNLYSTAKSGLLYRISNGTNSFFSEHTNEIEFHKQNILWGRKLNTAIEKKLITPYYQGIMDNKTGKIVKYECLVRMEDEGTIILPDKFLNLASAMGIMKLITIIVMDKAFIKLKDTDRELSINITQFDLEYKDFAQLVEAKLNYYNIAASRITFEILENISLAISNQSLKTLQKLKELGCKIAIDDFGVHYSNLARLLEIQPDYLKIDGWFIKNILKNHKAYLVTKAIIELSHSLNAEVIAEFVSEKEIQDKLLEMGVEHSQGYFIGKPDPEILG